MKPGVTVNSEKVIKKLHKMLDDATARKIQYEVIMEARNIIEQRSAKGQGLKGQLKRYSTGEYYRPKGASPKGQGGRTKTKTGKAMDTIFYQGGYRQFSALTKGSTRVNLSASGQMFQALQGKVLDKFSSMLYFSRQRQALKAMAVHSLRPFFGLTRTEMRKLLSIYRQLVKRYVFT